MSPSDKASLLAEAIDGHENPVSPIESWCLRTFRIAVDGIGDVHGELHPSWLEAIALDTDRIPPKFCVRVRYPDAGIDLLRLRVGLLDPANPANAITVARLLVQVETVVAAPPSQAIGQRGILTNGPARDGLPFTQFVSGVRISGHVVDVEMGFGTEHIAARPIFISAAFEREGSTHFPFMGIGAPGGRTLVVRDASGSLVLPRWGATGERPRRPLA